MLLVQAHRTDLILATDKPKTLAERRTRVRWSEFSLDPRGSSMLLQAHMRGEDPHPRAPFLPAEGSKAAGLGHLGSQRQQRVGLLQIMSGQDEGRKVRKERKRAERSSGEKREKDRP